MNPASLFHSSKSTKSFAAGEVILEHGQQNSSMYVVLDGEIDITVHGVTVETLKEGGIFGEMSLVDQSPCSATAFARVPARVAVVGRQQFIFLVQEHPTFALHLMGVLADRLRRMDDRASGS